MYLGLHDWPVSRPRYHVLLCEIFYVDNIQHLGQQRAWIKCFNKAAESRPFVRSSSPFRKLIARIQFSAVEQSCFVSFLTCQQIKLHKKCLLPVMADTVGRPNEGTTHVNENVNVNSDGNSRTLLCIPEWRGKRGETRRWAYTQVFAFSWENPF